MTGAKNFIDHGNGLSFRIPVQGSKVNYVKVTLNSMDTYDMELGKIRGEKYDKIKVSEGIHAEDMKGIIEKTAGIRLSLS